MEVFNLNIRPGKACPVLHCSQFDKGRMFRANLFDGAEVFTLTGSETLSVIEKKTDGNMVTIGVANTSDSYVVFGTTEQMTALAGCQLCELRIVDGEDLIGSANFLLDCEESPDTGIESESSIHNLQEQIGEAVAEQYSGEDVIFDSTPTAGHGVGFAVTSEGVKTELDKKADTDDLAPVATSGDYNDLDNLPTIPENLQDLGDVEITSPTAGQIIEYDDNAGKWKNVANPASTTNFGAPYDENATYNVPSLVVENNLLYKLNAGEDDVTGPFDPTKWTQTSLAELTAEDFPLSSTDPTPTAEAIGDLSYKFGELPSEIRCGEGNYSGLKGGGHANRVTVPITFSTPMTGTQYAVFIVISDAYSDYPYVQGYCFGGSRTVNGFTATILSMSSNTVTQISGTFYWVAVRYK